MHAYQHAHTHECTHAHAHTTPPPPPSLWNKCTVSKLKNTHSKLSPKKEARTMTVCIILLTFTTYASMFTYREHNSFKSQTHTLNGEKGKSSLEHTRNTMFRCKLYFSKIRSCWPAGQLNSQLTNKCVKNNWATSLPKVIPGKSSLCPHSGWCQCHRCHFCVHLFHRTSSSLDTANKNEQIHMESSLSLSLSLSVSLSLSLSLSLTGECKGYILYISLAFTHSLK